MRREKILKEAIEKAIDNGFMNVWKDMSNVEIYVYYEGIGSDWVDNTYFIEVSKAGRTAFTLSDNIIFDNDFAKAFFGEKEYPTHFDGGIIKNWQYHLMMMVLEEDPIKYLE